MDNKGTITKNKLGLTLDEMDKLVKSCNDAIWVVLLKEKSYTKEGEEVNAVKVCSTGVCIDSSGFILTSYFGEDCSVVCLRRSIIGSRRIITKKYIEVVTRKKNWGFCLLKVRDQDEISCVKIALGNGLPFLGQGVVSIGHCDNLEYSAVEGRITYDCGNDGGKALFVPPYNDTSCIDKDNLTRFNPDHRYTVAKWGCRVAGHCKNMGANCGSLQIELPLIEICGLPVSKNFLGSPVFNSKGYMVGLVIFTWQSSTYALHAAALGKILSETVDSNKMDEPSGSRQTERKQKRRRQKKRKRE